MSSVFQEYPSREDILLLLKEKGPMSVNELSRELNITRSAIRQHVFYLKRKGLLDHFIKRQDMGRPPIFYKLTEKAEGFFYRESDRRHEERIKKEIYLVLEYQGQYLEAESTDISKEGIGIRISGETPLGVGNTIELSASHLRIKGKIIWINTITDKSLIGLQRIN